ncbi:response regulator transcription factor [Erysipelotrichaceae bacterium OttesenSCG-928-M19]|nr:response regulator transcription factor [Erysipelotrichaceae bacterium OttesenSCG-928-M19]
MEKILIVEDDNDINGLLNDLLSPFYSVSRAFAGSEAKSILAIESFDLVILDLMLPGLSGEELIKIIREKSNMPIIVVTAKADISVLVDVLALGANDYIAKPFNTQEVIARIKAQLMHSNKVQDELKVGKLVLDQNKYQVLIDNEPLTLTQKEYEILKTLMIYPDRVFTKANLYEQIWQDTYYGDDNTISVHISRLRNKLKEKTNEDFIETVWGIGFKLKS